MVATLSPLLQGFAGGRCCHSESRNRLTNLSALLTTVLTTATLASLCAAMATRRVVQTSDSCTSMKSRIRWAFRMRPTKDALTIRPPGKAVVL
jgi:hypothetical protein